MKTTKKLLLVVLAMLLALTLCGAVFAESGEKTGDDAADAGDTTTTGAVTTGTESPKQVVLIALDGNGDPVKSSTGSSCMGGTTLFIKHDYIIEAKYYDSTTRELIETDDQLVLGVDSDTDYITVEGNRIKLAAAPEPYNFTIRVADPTAANGEASYPAAVNRFNVSLLELLIGFAGIYVIVSALRGTSNLFNDEFIKDEKKPVFRRVIRIMAIITGLALIAAAVLAIFFSYIDSVRIIRYVLLGLAFLLLIGMAIVNSVMIDREKRDKAQAGHSGPVNSSAAFEFDGSEPTIDEVLADLEKEKTEDIKPE